MLFNSIEFIFFFPLIVIIYFLLPFKYRNIFLLIGSYYFYASWKLEFLSLIIFSTLVDYFSALQMEKCSNKKAKKKYLYFSLIANIGLLFVFKYFNFFNENIRLLLDSISIYNEIPYLQLLLPVGISFYTFQTLSYTIDVYNGKTKPEKNIITFALYVSFFPQLVAGPIERSHHLLPQFRKNFSFDPERVKSGLKLMGWGFFKKIVIADNLAVFVDMVYNNPSDYHGFQSIIATLFFAFQIYCDFSGYSDIAIGIARILGYDLMKNFNMPYLANSIKNFWQRWHISLSTWFKDYVYIPLGGNKVIKYRWYYNLFFTFLISGLWHGANWTFVIWGALHGTYLVVENIFSDRAKRFDQIQWLNVAKVFFTFFIVCLTWVFFRANSVSDAFTILSNINRFENLSPIDLFGKNYRVELSLCIGLITALVLYEMYYSYFNKKVIFSNYVKVPFYIAFVFTILIFGKFSKQEFIYFQF